ncbi:MAG: tRNA (guanosine(46)-N7)-methyltransferase TrmB, partial [Pseudomonadota bacterium]|nr:tRNA (guanosine(46)-N7)-methyltransferase TrmB [Pseudomonadota bacterium]
MRTIRSFVKRKGRITPGQNFAIKELWPKYGIDYSDNILNLNALFDNNFPVHMEIGFGDGDLLVSQACSNININFLGIEVHEPGIGHCLLQIEKNNLDNIKIMSQDAIDVITFQIQDKSLHQVSLYFPDPWPKKRHHKRRLFQRKFRDLIHNKLVKGGTFCIATDWKNYAEHIDLIIKE